MIYHRGRVPLDLRRKGRKVKLLVRGGRRIWPEKLMFELPGMVYRETTEDGPNGIEVWPEWGFSTDLVLTGSAPTGWTSTTAGMTAVMRRTEDLKSYNLGQFTDCADSPTFDGIDTYTYWCRSIFPRDSEVKIGRLRAASEPGMGLYGQDVRNNPITSIIIAGDAQALPQAEYYMPADAAQLQADLRALGWAAATVVSSDAVNWEIIIPDVPYASFGAISRVCWPVYLIPNNRGEVVNPHGFLDFVGSFVNGAGVRTHIDKQFASLLVEIAAAA